MAATVAAFAAGMLFALGLGLSGMTQPAKVTGFLDVFGAWDPSLAFVMVGAIGVHAALRPFIVRRAAPVLAPRFVLPTRHEVDGRLIAGAALFGIGWGLGGFCPGPAITALASSQSAVVVFVTAMLAGMWLYQRFAPSRPAR